MTNFEYYKDEIEALGYDFSFTDNEIMECDADFCLGCKFAETSPCAPDKIKWLYEEHIEKPKLTKNERTFLEMANFKYVAREEDGYIYAFYSKPKKDLEFGLWESKEELWSIDGLFKDCKFSFIKWEDEEPWSVEDLLKLEVME